MRRLALVPLLLLLTAAAAPAAPAAPSPAAPGRDYDADNAEWAGVSELATLARNAGLTVDATDHVDWAELDPGHDVLFIFYPTMTLEANQVSTWIQAGGRVLLADDFGKCDEAFAELGLQRENARGVHAARWYDDNPQLPVATAKIAHHPLARAPDELYTNHPAIFRVTRGTPDVIFGFGPNEAVVVAGKLGDGRFVALSDPSVLINGMLAFDANATFAARLVDFLLPEASVSPGAAASGHPRLVLLTHGFVLSGVPPEPAHSELGLPGVAGALRDTGRWLRELEQWLPDDQALRAAAVLVAFALVLAGMALLPLTRAQRLDGSWVKAHGGHERDDFEKLVENYDDPKWDGNFSTPAAVLRENVAARLAPFAGSPEPFEMAPDELIRRVRIRAGARAAEQLGADVDRLRALPTREQAHLSAGARVVSRREFERVYDAARALERALPATDARD
jgi:hypothetical protein